MQKATIRWWQAVVALAVVIIAAGCTGRSTSANRQFNPAMRAATMVMGLERTDQPVTREQAGKLLPLFRALRGTATQ